MKVHIDSERCQGHGMCYVVAPSAFDVDDDGYGRAIHEEVTGATAEAVSLAEARCPENAVVLYPMRQESI
jgi:ferredoxin